MMGNRIQEIREEVRKEVIPHVPTLDPPHHNKQDMWKLGVWEIRNLITAAYLKGIDDGRKK